MNKKKVTLVLIPVLLFMALLFFLRPLGIIHGPIMFFYKYPLTWMLPLLTIVLALVIGWLLSRREKGQEGSFYYRERVWERTALFGFLGALLAFLLALFVSPVLTGQAIYNYYGPFPQRSLPEASETRILPKSVARVLARNGFASPTEALENDHIIRTANGLRWTFGQSPDGFFRRITKKTAGTAALDANITTRDLDLRQKEFVVAPGHLWADSVTWKAYKKHFFSEVAESIYIPDNRGGKILVPYTTYEGFFVKVPVLGGAYLIDPSGQIEDLSPEEALRNPWVQRAGRLFPADLARRVQDSFVYVEGIWNRIFTHREVLTVEDRGSESNRQPHYTVIADRGQWVSIGEPWGRSDAVGGIFFTDALSGKTRLWQAKRDAGLTSSRRAQDTTESLAIPGVSFRAGDFRAIEPRPVFKNGQLFFLVSIVPQSATTVSKSVIIEPKSNKAVAVFSHSDDPRADEKLNRYLLGQEDPGAVEATAGGEGGLRQDERALIKDLLRDNAREREILERLLEKYD